MGKRPYSLDQIHTCLFFRNICHCARLVANLLLVLIYTHHGWWLDGTFSTLITCFCLIGDDFVDLVYLSLTYHMRTQYEYLERMGATTIGRFYCIAYLNIGTLLRLYVISHFGGQCSMSVSFVRA